MDTVEVGVLFLLCGAAYFLANGKPAKVGTISGFATSTIAWETAEINEVSSSTEIHLSYPKFSSSGRLNAYIESILKGIIKEDKRALKEMEMSNEGNGTISLASTYSINGVHEGILSFEIDVSDFTGGGNGNHDTPYAINWDLKRGLLLENSQLFCKRNYIPDLVAPVRRQLELYFSGPQFGAHDRQIGDMMDQSITEGTEPKAENWQYFQITDKGLMVLFPPYQVAAGAAGIVRAVVSYDQIPNVVCLR